MSVSLLMVQNLGHFSKHTQVLQAGPCWQTISSHDDVSPRTPEAVTSFMETHRKNNIGQHRPTHTCAHTSSQLTTSSHNNTHPFYMSYAPLFISILFHFKMLVEAYETDYIIHKHARTCSLKNPAPTPPLPFDSVDMTPERPLHWTLILQGQRRVAGGAGPGFQTN